MAKPMSQNPNAKRVRRAAALYDIHANLPAVEAVLEELRREHVDEIIIGGDVLPGPMPKQTLDCLRDLRLPTQFIYGNGEVAILEVMCGKDPSAVPEAYRPIIRWNAQQLSASEEQFLASWPKTVTVDVAGLGEVLFCHATPRNENECFIRSTPEERLRTIFAGLNMAVCGHTHMQFDRMIGNTRVVNAGSVGMPFGKPGADWLLLGPDIELRHTEYDLAKAAERIRATSYPQAEEFAVHSVQQPPTEDAMLVVFARAELK